MTLSPRKSKDKKNELSDNIRSKIKKYDKNAAKKDKKEIEHDKKDKIVSSMSSIKESVKKVKKIELIKNTLKENIENKVVVADLSKHGDIDNSEAIERDIATNAFDVLLKSSKGGKFKILTPKKRIVRKKIGCRTPTSLDKSSIRSWLMKE